MTNRTAPEADAVSGTGTGSGLALAHFAAAPCFDDLPSQVLRRAADLFVDWVGCTLAGQGAWTVRLCAEALPGETGPAAGCRDSPSREGRSRRGNEAGDAPDAGP